MKTPSVLEEAAFSGSVWRGALIQQSKYNDPEAVSTDRIAFARASIMHDCSYLGGFLGILTASAYLIAVRSRLK